MKFHTFSRNVNREIKYANKLGFQVHSTPGSTNENYGTNTE